jgi:dethiobiotin synthetase
LNALLIAGTDARVGKTTVLMALIAYWQRYCRSRRLGLMKPIECRSSLSETDLADADFLIRQFNLDQTASEITSVKLSTVAPVPIAAAHEDVQIDLEQIWQQFQQLQQRDFVLLEAWGGLGSPLTAETTVADLAWDWHLPTILVVPIQPRAVADAVANVALARQAKVHLKGIILNAIPDPQQQKPANWQDWAPIELIQSLTQKPVLGCIPALDDPLNLEKLAEIASSWNLERLLPGLEVLPPLQSTI